MLRSARSSTTSRSGPFVDWAKDVFPALLEADEPFYIHEVHGYWNDVGSLAELRQGTFDALRGELRIELPGEDRGNGLTVAPDAQVGSGVEVEGPVWVGRGARIGDGARLTGPLVVGDGARVGTGAQLREHDPLPGHRGRGLRNPDRRDRRPRRDPREHEPQPLGLGRGGFEPLAALLLALGLLKRVDKEPDERDPHHDRLLDSHDHARESLVGQR